MHILQLFKESTQLMTFLSLVAAGLVYVFLTWILGQMGGGDVDDHDHDHSHSHQGHDGHDEHGHTTVKIFSPKLIAVFLIGLGSGGSIATTYGYSALVSTLIGIASGLSLGGTLFIFFKALYSQQSNSSLIVERAIGNTAIVNIEIPVNGSGEVGLSLNGQYVTCFARSRDNQAISRGTSVKVTSIEGSTLVVELTQYA